jgi:hypothetical protein
VTGVHDRSEDHRRCYALSICLKSMPALPSSLISSLSTALVTWRWAGCRRRGWRGRLTEFPELLHTVTGLEIYAYGMTTSE